MSIATPRVTTCEDMSRIKDRFVSHGYRMSTILSRLDIQTYRPWSLVLGQLSTKIGRFLSRSPVDEIDILIRVFLLNIPTEIRLISNLFSDDELDMLTEMRLISLSDGNSTVSCDIALFECEGLVVATDSFTKLVAANSFAKATSGVNPVMPLLSECYELASVRTRRRVGKTLDLCTGSGVHALLGSWHSDQVTGSDLNPRAIEFSKFNAALNGVRNVEFVTGDLFAAIGEESFDLILVNPPYMPATDSLPGDNFYCGGENGDALWSQIIRDLYPHLSEGGICQIIHMIVSRKGEIYREKLSSLLGKRAHEFSTIVMSSPIDFRNENLADISKTEFGVTNIRRNKMQEKSFHCQLPFIGKSSFDVGELFVTLANASTREQMEENVKSLYESHVQDEIEVFETGQ